MLIELKTKRRWILSVLETVADVEGARVVARATVKQTTLQRRIHVSPARKPAAQPTAVQGR